MGRSVGMRQHRTGGSALGGQGKGARSDRDDVWSYRVRVFFVRRTFPQSSSALHGARRGPRSGVYACKPRTWRTAGCACRSKRRCVAHAAALVCTRHHALRACSRAGPRAARALVRSARCGAQHACVPCRTLRPVLISDGFCVAQPSADAWGAVGAASLRAFCGTTRTTCRA